MMKRLIVCVCVLVWTFGASRGEGPVSVQVSPEVEVTWFGWEGIGPGFIHGYMGEEDVWVPRLTLPVDVFLGDWVYAFAKVRVDKGFDPGEAGGDFEVRADEVFVRVSPPGSGVSFQVGKSGTVFGGWVKRHDAKDNAFLTAPLVYDELTSVIDGKLFPGVGAIAANANKTNKVRTWLPVQWGPAYVPGVTVFGEWERVQVALEVRGRANSARPYEWDRWSFSEPSIGGRVGYRPDAAWDFGVSMSHGPYLQEKVSGSGEFDQTTVGVDVAYARGHWQIWGEAVWSRFELPNISDDATVWSYFLETRYKVSPQLYAALRWNHQFYDALSVPGGSVRWDNEVYRVDAAVGYRFSRELEVKMQYSWTHQDASFQNGENMVGASIIYEF